jgi:hypothetical protein
VQRLLLENNAQINRALEATKDSIYPYETKDFKSAFSTSIRVRVRVKVKVRVVRVG